MSNIIGIDLGTTNSVVYTYRKGNYYPVEIYGFKTTPSVIGILPETGEIIVGKKAKDRILLYPENIIASNKRNIGKQDFFYKIMGKKYSPVDISAMLLKYLAEGASLTLKKKIKEVVITVPAYFKDAERNNTKLAAEQAGLKVLKLETEPTAAAIAYGVNKNKNQIILVYDLGGGTFDVSILKIKDNTFEVLNLGGDTIGGDDFDLALMNYFLKKIQTEFDINIKNNNSSQARIAKQKLKEIAEKTKIELSNSYSSDIFVPNLFQGISFESVITRDEYTKLIEPYIEKTINIVNETIKGANITVNDINRVLCVGGSTKTPQIIDFLKEKIKSPYVADNVDEIVSEGAAITAMHYLSPTEGFIAINKTPKNLGIRVANDNFSVIIPQNTVYPCEFEKQYTTKYDYAEETEIEVFQGNNPKCNLNVPIGGFKFIGIQKAKAGKPKISVKFNLDESGILKINAKDLSTKANKQLIIERFVPVSYLKDDVSGLNIKDLTIGVSEVGYDDVGSILNNLELNYSVVYDFSHFSKLKKFNILFINCLSGGNPYDNVNALEKFVAKGGVLYASDVAKEHIVEAFPKELSFKSNTLFYSKTKCTIEDSEFERLLGKKNISIVFDSVLYHADRQVKKNSKVLLSAKGYPITLIHKYKKGHIVYTAFHNYGSASKEEKELLKFILLKAFSVALKTPLIELSKQISNKNR